MMLWPTILVVGVSSVLAVELTFELPDNAQQCFYEHIEKDTKATLEFQVIIGGNYDVDLVIEGPANAILYKQTQKQFDTVLLNTQQTGVYSACFSNQFSTFSHKLVYMNLHVGEDAELPYSGNNTVKQSAMTKMENSVSAIHKNLNTVGEYQTHHRLREMHGRKIAEDLNARVMWYSAAESLFIVTIFLTYLMIMKGFFSNKKSIR